MNSKKLYSPVYCKLWANDDLENADANEWGELLSDEEAAFYEEVIHETLLKERLGTETDRGLMTYYHRNDSVKQKVHSLLVDVEVHKGRLWGVAAYTYTGVLTSEELGKLRDELTGQYSDGFGEGFEQREIQTSNGELNVSLWSHSKNFFIATEEEFAQRLGLGLFEIDMDKKMDIQEDRRR